MKESDKEPKDWTENTIPEGHELFGGSRNQEPLMSGF